MKVLIKNFIIVSPGSSLHGTQQDIFIDEGKIQTIRTDITESCDQIIEQPGLHVSVGWMDGFANFCDPGEEYKETLESGAKAAAAGGFTDVMLMPNTDPAVWNKSQVEYIVQKGKALPVTLHPVGSVSKRIESVELSEMYDMHQAGAISFSDGTHPIQSSGLLQKGLEYIKTIDGTLIQLPDDTSIGSRGLMNEGVVSTQLGLSGKPALSEELMVARDLEILRYTDSKLHFTGISTRKSVELIAQAKKEGLRVSCSVTPYHLSFCEEDLATYDTNLKVNPPLRTREDRDALLGAIKTGVVDFISSHHQPQDYDHKVCEFGRAAFGMETLESVFGAARMCGIDTELFVEMQSRKIRNTFKLSIPEIAEGQKAVLTLFNPEEEYIFTKERIFSKCSNNAFVGKALKGRVIGTINGDNLFLS